MGKKMSVPVARADEVPVQVAHCVTPELWKQLYQDTETKFKEVDGLWGALFIIFGCCPPHFPVWKCCPAECECCPKCLNSGGYCCCIPQTIERVTDEIIVKHQAAFKAVGVELTSSGLNRHRYKTYTSGGVSHGGGGGAHGGGKASTTESKERLQPTISITLRAETVNPELPAAIVPSNPLMGTMQAPGVVAAPVAEAVIEPADQNAGGGAGTAAAAPAADEQDPKERLKKLTELKEAGLLTEEEFATKRAEIISTI